MHHKTGDITVKKSLFGKSKKYAVILDQARENYFRED